MSFQLKLGKSLHEGIRRVVQQELQDALEYVTQSANGARDEAVHEARKCCKKVRALLRLVRPAIRNRSYRTENTTFRDTARPLSAVRDAKILVQSVEKLAQHFADRVRGQPFTAICKELKTHQRAVGKRVLDEEHAFGAVEAAVRQALARLDDWTDVPNHWTSVGKGVQQVYRHARRACVSATQEPTMENLHEWRKQVKYLRYQLAFLRALWPEMMEQLTSYADHLGELLGDDHDLAVLRQMVGQNHDRFGDAKQVELLFALIDRRRQELVDEATLLGYRFFQDGPRDLYATLARLLDRGTNATEDALERVWSR